MNESFRIVFPALVFASVALAAAPGAGGATSSNLMDRQFVQKAAYVNLEEIEMGRLARAHGQMAQVRQIGARLVRDHTQAQKDLRTAALSLGLSIPQTANARARMDKQQLSRYWGSDFDHRWATEQLNDHMVAGILMRNEIAHGANGLLKRYAARGLELVDYHMDLLSAVEPTPAP